jgi:hypothetical protein
VVGPEDNVSRDRNQLTSNFTHAAPDDRIDARRRAREPAAAPGPRRPTQLLTVPYLTRVLRWLIYPCMTRDDVAGLAVQERRRLRHHAGGLDPPTREDEQYCARLPRGVYRGRLPPGMPFDSRTTPIFLRIVLTKAAHDRAYRPAGQQVDFDVHVGRHEYSVRVHRPITRWQICCFLRHLCVCNHGRACCVIH